MFIYVHICNCISINHPYGMFMNSDIGIYSIDLYTEYAVYGLVPRPTPTPPSPPLHVIIA